MNDNNKKKIITRDKSDKKENIKFCIGECNRIITNINNKTCLYCPSCDRILKTLD